MKNYYNILKISYEADAGQIRHAYRQMSMRYHPDRNGGRKEYEEKFKEINEAYQVLKDPIRRWQYRRDIQPRSGASGFSKKWETPDYAARSRPSEKTSRRQRSSSPADSRGMDFPGFFWSCVLLFVFFLPFSMVETVPAQGAERSFVSFQVEDAGSFEERAYDVKERIDRRYQRDFYHLQEIRKADPDLRGLDLETGYYELNGKTVKFSWEMLKLIRQRGWKS